MNEACNTIDGLDEFIALCDEHENEMNLEAARKLYRKSDFDCDLCLHQIKQLGCPFKVCAYTPEKVCCGCATLTAAIKYMIGEIHNERFTERVYRYMPRRKKKRKKVELMLFYDPLHRIAFYNQYLKLNHQNAGLIFAVYLLTADNELWKYVWKCVDRDSISFVKIKPKGLSPDAYILLCAAKDLYLGTEHISLSELADPVIVKKTTFCLVLNALGIRRFGYSYLSTK